MSFIFPQKENICAVIVTYHPDEGFAERVEKIYPQVGRIVIVDNNSRSLIKEHLRILVSFKKNIVLIENKENFGIATALNQGCSWAHTHGYCWALTFDQDTLVKSFIVQRFTEIFKDISKKEKVAILGANFMLSDTKKMMVTGGKNQKRFVEKQILITSGSLTSLSIYNEIGPFREEFFIDSVDHEYCLRARARGFKVIMVLEPLMKHCIGEKTIHLPIFNVLTPEHTPFRRYYITRNALIVVREYFLKYPFWAIPRFIRILISIVIMFLYEKKRFKKFKYVLLGIWDAITFNTKRNILRN